MGCGGMGCDGEGLIGCSGVSWGAVGALWNGRAGVGAVGWNEVGVGAVGRGGVGDPFCFYPHQIEAVNKRGL